MRTTIMIALAFGAAVALTACDNPNGQDKTQTAGALAATAPAKIDASFVDNAAIAGLFEVESSRLALDRATKPQVKEFAQMMVDDHTKANDELKGLVEGGKVTGIGKAPAKLDGAHEAKLAELKAATDVSGFENKYQEAQLEGHKQAVTLFENEASGGQDPVLKEWAKKTLPKLKEHLAKIEGMANAGHQ